MGEEFNEPAARGAGGFYVMAPVWQGNMLSGNFLAVAARAGDIHRLIPLVLDYLA